MTIDVGDVLGDRYELRTRLPAGRRGRAYRALDREREREVAITALGPHRAGDAAVAERVRAAARALARADHPGIVPVLDLVRGDDDVYLVEEIASGASLEAELARGGPLTWERCAEIGSQVADALAAAHAVGVVHGDLTAADVLLAPSGAARVGGFGAARAIGASAPREADLAGCAAILRRAGTGGDPPRRLPPAAAAAVARAAHPGPGCSAQELAAALRATIGRPGERAPAPRGRRRLAAAAAVLALGGVAVGGLAAAGALGGEGSEEPTSIRLRGGSGSIEVPAAWRASGVAGLPGMVLRKPLAVTPVPPTGGRLVMGLTDARGPTLLPAPFRRRLQGAPPTREPARLGNLGAYRYRDLRVAGVAGPVTAFVVPTGRGVQTIACVAPAAPDSGFSARCERAARSLRLSGAWALPVGPSPEYTILLDEALGRLDARRRALRARLGDAATPAARATLAGRIADAYAATARRLHGFRLGPEGAGLNERIVAALRAGGASHRALAAAARSGDPAAYRAAATGVRRAEAGLARALEALLARGYSVRG